MGCSATLTATDAPATLDCSVEVSLGIIIQLRVFIIVLTALPPIFTAARCFAITEVIGRRI